MFGHSLGGLYASYLYLTEPGLFQSYIASDSALWYNNQFCKKLASGLTKNSPQFESTIFFSSSDSPLLRNTTKALYNKLKFKSSKSVSYVAYPDDNHMSVPVKTLIDGLKFTFFEYDVHKSPNFYPEYYNLEKIKVYYKSLSDKRGYEILPPPKIIKHAGFYYLYELKQPEKAVQVYHYYTELYPESSLAFELLALSYFRSGDVASARKYCSISLKLDSESLTAQRLMRKLER